MSTSLRLLNIIYTNDMEASVRFYEQLGLFRKEDSEINSWWNEFAVGDATIALHWNNDKPISSGSNLEIHLQISPDEFESTYTSIHAFQPTVISKRERQGRYFRVTDPNGVVVQFTEIS